MDASRFAMSTLPERAPRLWTAANGLRLSLLGRFALRGVVSRGPSTRRAVALTFDDGPDPVHTPAILDALDAVGARATFFFTGAAIEAAPELARRAAARHEIGTHLYSHDRAASRSLGGFGEEARRSIEVHERVLGHRPAALRFPFGDPGVIGPRDAARFGLTAYHWTFSSEDSSATSGAAIVRHVAPRLHAGAIVLLHDGRGPGSTRGPGTRQPTVDAVPHVVRAAVDRGFALVTLRELFGG